MDSKQSFSTSEVARYCHVTADTIRKWAEANRIKVFKTPGGHRRIRREELLRFLQDNNIPIHSELSNSGIRILVIDQDPAIVNVVIRFIERSRGPFVTETAQDAFDAGSLVTSFTPDVVLLDSTLPGVDGLEVCRRIANSRDGSKPQVILLVDGADPQVADLAQSRGAALTMRKPFTPDDLRRALARVGVEVN